MRFAAFLVAFFLLMLTGPVWAADDFLPPEKAFRISVRAPAPQTIEVVFAIAPGYYMYREQFRFSAEGVTLGDPELPPGKVKFDETFRKEVETYRDELRIALPVVRAPASFNLTVIGQGCADQGLCYPPMPSVLHVSLTAFGGDGSAGVVATGDAAGIVGAAGLLPPSKSSTERAPRAGEPISSDGENSLDRALQSGRFWTVILVFFGAGLLLSLTPCVLPMLPILSSIIAGEGGIASARTGGVMLAASYSLGMALVYTGLGVAAGLAGEGLAATLQTPWILGAFALLLVLLSLSMFGVYELRMPHPLTGRLAQASQRLQGGRLAGVFLMGGLSALIVSPCVAAPLAGALVYLSQTRDVVLGGSALFALAVGMSVPLLLLGLSAGALLPKAGPWMEGIKQFFGVLLLGVSVWTVQPLLPASLTLAAWGTLLALAAVLLRPFSRHRHGRFGFTVALRRLAGVVAALFGAIEFLGATSGGGDPLQPLAHLAPGKVPVSTALPFHQVRNVAELEAALSNPGKPVMLDFYADWCVSCKEMERFTFSDPDIQRRMSAALLLKADVTRNSAEERELLRRFKLFGPPGTVFFDAQGRELHALRVIGFQSSERFGRTLSAAGL